MKQTAKLFRETKLMDSSKPYTEEELMIEFAKLYVKQTLKDIEEKLFEALDDREYLEENVCDVIEEMRNYKLDNIK